MVKGWFGNGCHTRCMGHTQVKYSAKDTGCAGSRPTALATTPRIVVLMENRKLLSKPVVTKGADTPL